jgi:hypothetical protein
MSEKTDFPPEKKLFLPLIEQDFTNSDSLKKGNRQPQAVRKEVIPMV